MASGRALPHDPLLTALGTQAARSLKPKARRVAVADARAAVAKLARGRFCQAMGDLEKVRVIASQTGSYRKKSHAAVARLLVGAVNRDERALLAHRRARGCAMFGQRTKLLLPQHPTARTAPVPTGEHDQPGMPKPQRPTHRDHLAMPGKLKATPEPDPFAGQDQVGGVLATVARDPVTLLSSTNFVPASAGFPEENNAASGGGVAVYTGNKDAYFSVNNGVTFHEIAPGTLFGPGDGSFCCDQVVRYSPVVDRFFWLIQGTQGYMLAVASPAQIVANLHAGRAPSRAWTVYALTPSTFNDSTSSFDFPDMAVGPTALWLDWNRVNVGKILARINLRQISAGGRFSIFYWKLTGGATFDRLAQQPNAVEYLVSNDDGGDPGKATLHFSNEMSPLLQTVEVSHVAIPSANYASDLPPANPANPGNWLYRTGFVVGGATEAHGSLWIVFDAGRDFPGMTHPSWMQPHLQLAAYQTDSPAGSEMEPSSFTLTHQIVTANTLYAVGFGFLASDPDGDVAMSYSYGGPTIPPSAATMVLSGPATGAVNVIRGDIVAPNAGIDRAQGDYSSVQPDGSSARGFVSAGYAAQNDPTGPHDHWSFVRIGFT